MRFRVNDAVVFVPYSKVPESRYFNKVGRITGVGHAGLWSVDFDGISGVFYDYELRLFGLSDIQICELLD